MATVDVQREEKAGVVKFKVEWQISVSGFIGV
jgi:hypothetical protein